MVEMLVNFLVRLASLADVSKLYRIDPLVLSGSRLVQQALE